MQNCTNCKSVYTNIFFRFIRLLPSSYLKLSIHLLNPFSTFQSEFIRRRKKKIAMPTRLNLGVVKEDFSGLFLVLDKSHQDFSGFISNPILTKVLEKGMYEKPVYKII